MRSFLALSLLVLSACTTAVDSAPDLGAADEASSPAPLHAHHGPPPGLCAAAPAQIAQAFAHFDAATSPPAPGAPASLILAPWLSYLDTDVVFISGNAPPLVGREAVAGYFAPLLPAIGSVVHDLDSVSPVCGEDDAWSVRGTLLLTRRVDGRAVTPIPFTDTLFFDHGKIARYEIRFDPTPIGELFAP